MADRLDRIALTVDDVDRVAGHFEEVFGMAFQIFEVPSLGIKVALGNDGIELVEKIGESDLERLWKPPLAALVVRVADVEECAAKMSALGVEIDHRVDTPGGIREISFGTNFHGLPLVVCDGDGDIVEGVGAHDLQEGGTLTPTVAKSGS